MLFEYQLSDLFRTIDTYFVVLSGRFIMHKILDFLFRNSSFEASFKTKGGDIAYVRLN